MQLFLQKRFRPPNRLLWYINVHMPSVYHALLYGEKPRPFIGPGRWTSLLIGWFRAHHRLSPSSRVECVWVCVTVEVSGVWVLQTCTYNFKYSECIVPLPYGEPLWTSHWPRQVDVTIPLSWLVRTHGSWGLKTQTAQRFDMLCLTLVNLRVANGAEHRSTEFISINMMNMCL